MAAKKNEWLLTVCDAIKGGASVSQAHQTAIASALKSRLQAEAQAPAVTREQRKDELEIAKHILALIFPKANDADFKSFVEKHGVHIAAIIRADRATTAPDDDVDVEGIARRTRAYAEGVVAGKKMNATAPAPVDALRTAAQFLAKWFPEAPLPATEELAGLLSSPKAVPVVTSGLRADIDEILASEKYIPEVERVARFALTALDCRPTREDARLFLIQIQSMALESQVSNLMDFMASPKAVETRQKDQTSE